MGENGLDFPAGQDSGRPALGPPLDRFFQAEIDFAKHLAGEEDHGVEGLYPAEFA